jgi:arylsulfatase A-like enzyme
VGRSYAGFLQGAPPRQWTNRLFFEYSYVRALRTQTLKYVERGEGWPSELFDLEADPGEATNLIDAPAYRAQREALRRELEARFKKLGAPPIDKWRSISPQIPRRNRTAREKPLAPDKHGRTPPAAERRVCRYGSSLAYNETAPDPGGSGAVSSKHEGGIYETAR